MEPLLVIASLSVNLSGVTVSRLRPDRPVLIPLPAPHWEDGGIANPAVYVDPADDSILLAYRGTDDDGIAFAAAPAWNATFTRLFGTLAESLCTLMLALRYDESLNKLIFCVGQVVNGFSSTILWKIRT